MSLGEVRILVEVTDEDIEKGEQHECGSCPIALALNRLLKPGYFARVGYGIGVYSLYRRDVVTRVSVLPDIRNVNDFINRFDHGKKVEPFSFRAFVERDFVRKDVPILRRGE